MTESLRNSLINLGACVLLLAALLPGAEAAQWPSRPIRFVLGPAPDVLPRMVGQKLGEVWGQQVVVDQRPGAATQIDRARRTAVGCLRVHRTTGHEQQHRDCGNRHDAPTCAAQLNHGIPLQVPLPSSA